MILNLFFVLHVSVYYFSAFFSGPAFLLFCLSSPSSRISFQKQLLLPFVRAGIRLPPFSEPFLCSADQTCQCSGGITQSLCRCRNSVVGNLYEAK